MDVPAQAPSVDGLLWALHFRADGLPRPIPPDERPAEGWTWVHYDLVHANSVDAILNDACLPPVAKTVLTGRDETPRMLADDDVVTGVLPAFAIRTIEEPDALVGWHFAMRPGRLVTGRRAPVHSLAALHAASERGHALPAPVALIAEALADFGQEMRRRVAALAADLDTVEDALLETARDPDLGDLAARIGVVRRAASHLRRAIAPVVRLLEDDVDDLPGWAEPCPAHDTALRQSVAATDDLNALQDRARVLQDELAARQAEETNRRLYIVSVVTTMIMPVTLVTGFFGMNTGGMFLSEWHPGTWVATVVCVVALFGTWWLMRWRKLL